MAQRKIRAGSANDRVKVAYLFGAGATHAELVESRSDRKNDATFLARNSLLLAEVSKRVCRELQYDNAFPAQIQKLISPRAISNLELFISLLEKNQVASTEAAVRELKKRLERDIVSRLRRYGGEFYLHKALLEFHKRSCEEELTGLITLNYDRVLDEAYELIQEAKPNYCLSMDGDNGLLPPLLKLHGGFGLTYRSSRLPIITPGVNKNYLELPYNYVWGRALEVLLDSDILRIIGCSLSQNDMGVVDLLFKAHLRRRRKGPLVLQVIDFDPPDNRIREQFGFFPALETAMQIEGQLIADEDIRDSTTGSNPFKIWLRAKIERAMEKDPRQFRRTRFLRRVLE